MIWRRIVERGKNVTGCASKRNGRSPLLLPREARLCVGSSCSSRPLPLSRIVKRKEMSPLVFTRWKRPLSWAVEDFEQVLPHRAIPRVQADRRIAHPRAAAGCRFGRSHWGQRDATRNGGLTRKPSINASAGSSPSVISPGNTEPTGNTEPAGSLFVLLSNWLEAKHARPVFLKAVADSHCNEDAIGADINDILRDAARTPGDLERRAIIVRNDVPYFPARRSPRHQADGASSADAIFAGSLS